MRAAFATRFDSSTARLCLVLRLARRLPWCTTTMMLRHIPLFCAASVFVMGCGARMPISTTVSLQPGTRVVSPDNHDRGEILLWVTKNEGKQTRTFRLAVDGSLNVLGENDGIILTTTHGELTWQAQEKEVKLDGCEHYDGSPAVPNKGSIMIANLVNSKGDVLQKVVDSNDTNGGSIDELQHHVTLLGTIGPYLFVSESSYMYACGAHGGEMASAMVWDAESGKAVDLWAELPGKDKLADIVKRKLAEAEGEDVAPEEDDSTKPEPAQFWPVYGDRGSLRLDAQFAQWACYVCSDHQWSSYTRSATVPTDWIPERMRTWVTPPVVVKEFLEAHREWKLGGWSKR